MGARNTRSQPRRAPQQAIATLVAATLLAAPSLSPALELSDVAAGKYGFVINGVTPDDRAGSSLAGVGDVNGDGLDDVVLCTGIPAYGPETPTPNTCYVVFGKSGTAPINLSDIALSIGGFAVLGGPSYTNFSGVVGLGDLNHDGYSDFAIACPSATVDGLPDAGAVLVCFGKPDTSPVNPSDLAAGLGGYPIHGGPGHTEAALILRAAGDVNGDGLQDLLVTNRDVVYSISVVFGKADSIAISLLDVANGIGGFQVSRVVLGGGFGAGDMNGDGLDDFTVTVPGFLRSSEAVIFGKTDTASLDAADIASSSAGFIITGALYGVGAGDVDGDGLDDLLLKQQALAVNSFENTFVLLGKQNATNVTAEELLAGVGGFPIWMDIDGDHVNTSYSPDDIAGSGGAGDVNGDGLGDLILGFPGLAYHNQYNGVRDAAYIVYGKQGTAPIGLSDVHRGIGGFALGRIDYSDAAGSPASAAGDVNGDGIDDVLIGASRASPGGRHAAGQAFVVFGGHPLYPDADMDRLSDSAEMKTGVLARPWNTGTDPALADSDHDGVDDGAELSAGTDPNNRKISPAPQPPQHIVTQTSLISGTRGFVIHGIDPGDRLGRTVSRAGDVNNDGIDDVIVGAQTAELREQQKNEGAAYVVFGSRTPHTVNLSDVANGVGGFAIYGDYRNDFIGRVSPGGDINGDGFGDVIVTRVEETIYERMVHVVFGKSDTQPVFLASVRAGNGGGFAILTDSEHSSAAGLGDMNGDGLGDIVLQFTGTGHERWLGAVVFGKTDFAMVDIVDPLAGVGGFVIEGVDDQSGRSAANPNVGDVNGDGINDMAFARGTGVSGAYWGCIFVVFGKPDVNAVQVDDIVAGIGGFAVMGSGNEGYAFPTSAGDVNGDGLADIVAYYNTDEDNSTDAHAAHIIFGKQNTNPISSGDIESGVGGFVIRGSMGAILAGPYDGDGFGDGPVGAGDVNGDGFNDLLINAIRKTARADVPAMTSPEWCYVVYGKPDTAPVELFGIHYGTGGFIITGAQDNRLFGISASPAGDVNADGLDDVIVGEPATSYVYNDNGSPTNPGHAYVIYGFKPTAPDTDQDLLPDYAETGTGNYTTEDDTGTGRNNPDSDGDGVLDGIEVDLGTDPNNPLDFPILPLGHRILFATLIGIAAACLIWPLAPRRADGKGKT